MPKNCVVYRREEFVTGKYDLDFATIDELYDKIIAEQNIASYHEFIGDSEYVRFVMAHRMGKATYVRRPSESSLTMTGELENQYL